MMVTDRLRVEPRNASVINDYRIHDGEIEVRTLDSVGHAFDLGLSGWRLLDSDHLRLHFALDTIVARWLQDRLPDKASVRRLP